jgi:Flp pilus assembly protein TadG
MKAVMTKGIDLAKPLIRRISCLTRDERGVSAVEFAMLLPLMLSLYLGAVELSQGIGAKSNVMLTARTIADLVSRVTTINNADMADSLNASAAVMTPYSVSNLKVTVSSVTIDSAGKATIAWSDTLNGTARAVGSTVTLPAALTIANTSLIWSEAQYSYKPTIGYVVTGTLMLKDQMYLAPRLSTSVTRTAT